jgi:hypothetical protein
MISRIIQTSVYVIRLSFASADNIDLGLNNSWYHAQPHPIIAYSSKPYSSANRQHFRVLSGTYSVYSRSPDDDYTLV